MDTIALQVLFCDITTLQAAGLRVPENAQVQCLPGAIPIAGEIVTIAGQYYSGTTELARFRVAHRAHRFGGNAPHTVQISLELVVLHQP